ncbi:hypothetical protein D3C87_35490 [compost metagenome]
MNSPMKLILRMCMLGIVLSISGNLNAHPTHKHPKSRYYYYPKQNIYYDPVESVYFVWERSYWKPVPHPSGRYVSIAHPESPRFELWISSAHPYYYNVEHRRTYHSYRVVTPAPAPRIRAASRPRGNANVSFQVNINPEPVYVERHVVIVKDRGRGHHHHHPRHGHRSHPGHHGHGHSPGKGHRHH